MVSTNRGTAGHATDFTGMVSCTARVGSPLPAERVFMRQTAHRFFVFVMGVFFLVRAAGGQRAAAPPNAPTAQRWTSADLNQQANSLLAQAAATNGSAG